MTKLFISYRREDTEGLTGRIYDRLAAHFGKEAVFMDIDTIPFGVDFVDHLSAAVSQCDILLAIIGEQWLDVCHKEGPHQGQRRLDDASDFVRIEIQAALERNIPVIPVLIGKTAMPGQEQLPTELKKLARRNAAEVRLGRDFHIHVDRLIQGIEYLLQSMQKAGDLEEAEEKQQERLLRQQQKEARQKGESDRRRREQEETERQRKEVERLQKEGEIKLVQFIREALDRTQGKPTKDDTAAANELCKQHRIDKERAKQIVEEVREQWTTTRQEAERILAQDKRWQEQKKQAERHGMNVIDLRGMKIPPAIIEKVPESVARENIIIPLAEENGILQIVISDPPDHDTMQKWQFILNQDIQFVLAPKEQIVEAINRHYFALQ
jgi:hypothetical protein